MSNQQPVLQRLLARARVFGVGHAIFSSGGIATVHNTLTTVYMDPVEKCRKPDLAPPKPMPSAATKMSAIP